MLNLMKACFWMRFTVHTSDQPQENSGRKKETGNIGIAGASSISLLRLGSQRLPLLRSIYVGRRAKTTPGDTRGDFDELESAGAV